MDRNMRGVIIEFLFFALSYFGETALTSSNKYSRFPKQDTIVHDNTPYLNYLNTPRLHFKGRFKADVPTINNLPENYDFENVDFKFPRNWNPKGTGEFSVKGTVMQVCYHNETCTADSRLDPVVGGFFGDAGTKASAKIISIDPDAQIHSNIFGWSIDVAGFFTADFTPVIPQFYFKRVSGVGIKKQGKHSAAFQSVLTNIKWGDSKKTSNFAKDLKNLLRNDGNIDGERLSIRFNLDLLNNTLNGRIAGSIGVMGKKSSPVYNRRFVVSKFQQFNDSPFTVDTRIRKVTFDFGNTFQVDASGNFSVNKIQAYVAFSLDNKVIACDSKLMWLGKVRFTEPEWYDSLSGIQSFPDFGVLSVGEMDLVSNRPLGVFEVEGDWPKIKCTKVILAEPADGIGLHPFNKWTGTKDPNEIQTFKVLATQFGKPLRNANVIFKHVCYETKTTCNINTLFTKSAKTDKDGIATFTAWTRDPGTPRKFIDGQVHRWLYWLEGRKPDIDNLMKNDLFGFENSCLYLRVFNHFAPHLPPTWLDDIYPIFKQYAVLYPAMTENFLDLGNYYDVISQKTAILMSMNLPMSHPNHMPASRDLSYSKRKMILEWLSKEKPLIGRPKDFYSLKNLRKQLQTALKLELSTIPPYLTAMASIKYGYNSDVKNIIKTILMQEMNHMTLVANILNAVGGNPVIYHKKITPIYPSRLPGGVQPDLMVPIEKLSIDLIRNVFMKIEEPEVSIHKSFHFQHTFNFVQKAKLNSSEAIMKRDLDLPLDAGVDEQPFPCMHPKVVKHLDLDLVHVPKSDHISTYGLNDRKGKRHFPSRPHGVEKKHNTIGTFYLNILNMICYLTNCGKNNTIFTGDPKKQVDYIHGSMHGESFKVTDFHSAVKAIRTVVDQGEGSSICNPVFWSNGTTLDLSHYYLFSSIVEKRQILATENKGMKHERTSSPHLIKDQSDFHRVCRGRYSFEGPKIDFDPNGVWPMIPNPKLSKYAEGSRALVQAKDFNRVYTRLLKSLDRVFNGHPEELQDGIGLMYSVQVHLKQLLRTPVSPDGDPDIGPNAGPSFEFTPQ